MATTKLIAIADLKSARFNPKTRLTGISGLAESIQEVGLLDPIKVSPNNEIIDGHRRVAAYQYLGLEEIECILLKGDLPTIYAHINSQSRKLSGNETLQVYLKQKTAVSPRAKQLIEDAEKYIGRELVIELAKNGMSIHTYRHAKRLAVEAGVDLEEWVPRTVRWLIKYKCVGAFQRALAQLAPAKILRIVEKDAPLKETVRAGQK